MGEETLINNKKILDKYINRKVYFKVKELKNNGVHSGLSLRTVFNLNKEEVEELINNRERLININKYMSKYSFIDCNEDLVNDYFVIGIE